jgi:hypothetical protein
MVLRNWSRRSLISQWRTWCWRETDVGQQRLSQATPQWRNWIWLSWFMTSTRARQLKPQ